MLILTVLQLDALIMFKEFLIYFGVSANMISAPSNTQELCKERPK
jgi:hypothetical protein